MTNLQLVTAARRFGTPVFVYDLDGIAAGYRRLRRLLPATVSVHYALKANGNLAVARTLARLGAGVEVCSEGEVHLARHAGFPAEATILTGPGKTRAELTAEVGLTVVESSGEAGRLSALASASSPRAVLVRVNPARVTLLGDIPIASPVSKFGVDEADIGGIYPRIAALPGIAVVGIHMNVASGVLDAAALLDGHRHLLAVASDLETAGNAVPVVDLGGGIGAPYRPGEAPFDLAGFASGLAALVTATPHRRYILELGRHLVAEHGRLVTEVVDVKQSGGRRIVIVDAGIHTLHRPRLGHANALVEAVDRDGPLHPAIVAGPLLSPEDVLTDAASLPDVAPGDVLCLPMCGAYTFAHSLQAFSGHPTPAEAVVTAGDVHLARRRGDPADILRLQVDPSPRAAPLTAAVAP